MARHLILIGNSVFDDEKISNLDFVKNDIVDLNTVLGEYGDFDNAEIIMDKTVLEGGSPTFGEITPVHFLNNGIFPCN